MASMPLILHLHVGFRHTFFGRAACSGRDFHVPIVADDLPSYAVRLIEKASRLTSAFCIRPITNRIPSFDEPTATEPLAGFQVGLPECDGEVVRTYYRGRRRRTPSIPSRSGRITRFIHHSTGNAVIEVEQR